MGPDARGVPALLVPGCCCFPSLPPLCRALCVVQVRDFITDSAAQIRVQSLAELSPSDPERIITVSGARDQVLRAVALILNTVSAPRRSEHQHPQGLKCGCCWQNAPDLWCP